MTRSRAPYFAVGESGTISTLVDVHLRASRYGGQPSMTLLRTIVESCPTKLLLANPALDRRHYVELFQLNEMELDLLTGLIPRQQILLKRPDLAKVLTLAVDPKSYWIQVTSLRPHEFPICHRVESRTTVRSSRSY